MALLEMLTSFCQCIDSPRTRFGGNEHFNMVVLSSTRKN